jgi:hypothetical protein
LSRGAGAPDEDKAVPERTGAFLKQTQLRTEESYPGGHDFKSKAGGSQEVLHFSKIFLPRMKHGFSRMLRRRGILNPCFIRVHPWRVDW